MASWARKRNGHFSPNMPFSSTTARSASRRASSTSCVTSSTAFCDVARGLKPDSACADVSARPVRQTAHPASGISAPNECTCKCGTLRFSSGQGQWPRIRAMPKSHFLQNLACVRACCTSFSQHHILPDFFSMAGDGFPETLRQIPAGMKSVLP